MKKLRGIVASTLVVALWGCHRSAHKATQARPRLPVTVATVTRQMVSRPLDLTGSVIAKNLVAIVPKATGRILQLDVDEGYRVRAGQVVAVLDTPEAGWQMQQQRGAVSTAKANLDEASDNYRRMKDLAGQGVISAQQLMQAKIQVRVTTSQLRQVQAALALTQTQLGNRIVTSPVSGVVVQRVQDPGAMASPGSPIVSVAQGPYQAELAFAEEDLAAIHDGLQMTISADALPGRQFSGVVRDIAQMVDPQTHLLSCKVDLAQRGRLRIGMNVRATVQADPHTALVVPTDALVHDGGQTVVYLANAGRAREVPVVVGVLNQRFSEIKTGLTAGEQVIEKGNAFVRDGDPIEVNQNASS